MKNKYIVPSIYIHASFVLGILSSLSMRLIIVFKHVNPHLIRPTWYAGVIGYTIFFGYRYYISIKRRSLIAKHDLLGKIHMLNEVSTEDKELMEYVVLSIAKSKENLNYLFIFFSSFAAIATDLILGTHGM